MKDIYKALGKFKENDFKINKNLYNYLSNQQTPHTLFIACSDSRISPERLLQAQPGEIFHIRNIANIVPTYKDSKNNVSTTSAIEYAVKVLNVENIIVCGHSNCGGCAATIQPPSNINDLEYTTSWISQLYELRDIIIEENSEEGKFIQMRKLEQLNVIQQIKNLMTYEFINHRVRENKLRLNGWHYNIGSGEVSVYNQTLGEFEAHNR